MPVSRFPWSPVLAGTLMLSVGLGSAGVWCSPAASLAAPAPQAAGNRLVLSMRQLETGRFEDILPADETGIQLKTVRTERRLEFTRPMGWTMQAGTAIQLKFQHSPALLPERSSLNVLVNNRILKTIPLGKDNVTPTGVNIPIPPDLVKDRNTLVFQVDQHYTYKCEDPFSPELWTTVLPETRLVLAYSPKPAPTDLAGFPRPFFDELNYGKTQLAYLVSSGLSDGSLSALAAVATGLGQHVGWRGLSSTVGGSELLASNQHAVVVGTPSENGVIGSLAGGLKGWSGGQWVDPATGSPLSGAQGVLALVRNPRNPSRAVLIVSGNTPEGVNAAAQVLLQKPTNQLLVGPLVVIKEQSPGPQHPFRQWDGFIRGTEANFASLGLDTQTTRGITALPVYYKLKRMPDLFLPGGSKVKLKTIFSYSSQTDPSQSKLEVRLNGKAIKSVPLDDLKGRSLAELDLDIPAEEFHTFNDLEYQFHLYPDKYDMCRFVTDVHLWGTVHNTTKVSLPAEVKTPLPDVGLLNDGGFPFTVYPDLTDVAVVLPDSPTQRDLQTMVQVVSRLGRESKSRGGIRLVAHRAGTLPDGVRNGSHLIVLGTEDRNKLLSGLKDRAHLLVSGQYRDLKGPDAGRAERLASLNYTPDQGIVEELMSPWNGQRVAMLLVGPTDTAQQRIGQLFEDDKRFAGIQEGNLLVANAEGSKSLIDLGQGEAKFLTANELSKDTPALPFWAYVVGGVLALMGLFTLLKFLLGR